MGQTEDYNEKGCAYFKEGRVKDAIGVFRKAIDSKQFDGRILNNLGVVLLTCGILKKDVKLLDDAHTVLTQAQTAPELYYGKHQSCILNNVGVALCNLKEKWPHGYGYPEIINGFLKKALVSDQNNAGINYNVGHAYRLMGEYYDASGYLKKARELDKNNERILFELGCNYFLRGRFTKAIEHYARALELNPDFRDALIGKAKALNQIGKNNESTKALEEAKKLSGDPLEWSLSLIEN